MHFGRLEDRNAFFLSRGLEAINLCTHVDLLPHIHRHPCDEMHPCYSTTRVVCGNLSLFDRHDLGPEPTLLPPGYDRK
jgi:hypothetical protein